STRRTDAQKTEIVLLITPRIIRNVVRPELYAAEFPAGTDNAAGVAPLQIRSTAPGALALSGSPSGASPVPAAKPESAPAPLEPPPTSINLAGSTQASLGTEFTLSLVPSGGARIAQVDLVYDPTMVSFAATTPGQADPGRITL